MPSTAITTTGAPVPFTPTAITGTTYYVSPTGSDSNSGLSPSQAWQTVDRVNRESASLHPGDGVLFEGGAIYADQVLMPGWGNPLAGTGAAPIVFGSYGSGQASLPQGVWFHNASYLVFQNLNLGPQQGVTGIGNSITVQGCSIHDIVPGQVGAGLDELGINGIGSNWTIQSNTIDHTGDSGMLLRGDHFLVNGNLITNTGVDPAITWGAHGIYLKAADSAVTGNTIDNFHNDGVSVRYRDSVVSHNLIENGEIGIGWFQYDTIAGTSQWTDNTITGDTIVGLYVSPSDPVGGNTRESFVINGNTIDRPAPVGNWVDMNLEPTTGSYAVSGNTVG